MNSPNQLSFLPDDYLERRARRRTNLVCAMLFIVVAGGVGAAFTMSEKADRQVRQQFAAVDADYTAALKPIQQFQELQEKQKTMAQSAELTASLLEKVPRSFLLADITNSLPPGVSLLDFDLSSTKKVTATAQPAQKKPFQKKSADAAPPAPAGPQPLEYQVSMKMTGVANTDVEVAQLISKLSQSTLLKDVNLVISDEYKNGDDLLRKFTIEMSLDPKAEVQAAEKQRTVSVELEAR